MTTLTPVPKRFILHWGEMGTRWGINRTVAQIHALLYLSPAPLTAEEIAETLDVARSNVSTSLRELQGLGIVRPVHVLGDRRTHFEALHDVWQMFQTILEARKKREMDPTLDLLRSCVAELGSGGSADKVAQKRLQTMLEFFETVNACYEEVRQLPVGALRQLVGIRGKLKKLLGRS